jgi:CRP/FNR family cyclic AMP-dependent transcriptional regulator
VGRIGPTSEKIWFLKRCNLFERLTPSECQRLERHATLRSFKPREIVYFPSEPGATVLLLAAGRVKIKSLLADGKEMIFAFIEEGELFGELALLDGGELRREYAEVVEESRVVAIPREDVLWLMEHRADIALSITKLLGLRRRRIENRLRNVLFRPTRERLASLLLELLEQYGQQTDDGWEIQLRLSHQDLANLIGATRETVTSALGRLQTEGLIKINRRRITIRDRRRLSEEAGQDEPVPAAGGAGLSSHR